MVLIDVIYAAVIAIVLAAVLIGFLGWRRTPTSSAVSDGLFAVLLLLMLIWAGGVWLEPFGPALWGGYWLPFLIVGVVAVLLLLAIAPGRHDEFRRRGKGELQRGRPAENRPDKAVAIAFGLFFWFLVLALTVAIVLRYLYPRIVPVLP